MILVTGSTGNVGAELVRALVEAGERVRALVRDPRRGRLPDGVEVGVGDLNQPESLAGALTGVRGVFLLPGYADMPGLLNQIRLAGVERVVLLSGGSAGSGDTNNAVARYMIVSEGAVREAGVGWTFLRPGAFMSNALRWVPQLRIGDVVRVPFGGVRAAAVDPYDIAAVAARALLVDGHEGQIYRLSGPESLLPADQVAVLGKALGRELRCEELSNAEARAQMEASMPAEYVDAFFSFYVDGTLDESQVLPTVREVTGQPSRTFEQWAEAHADAFH
ncbi:MULTISPECIES: NAD(P)H-binding protein [unclassified Pseudofrankia]|uniref:NmrA family NAD(P)-binding protein n=1 Tax=unclassified Pseudofrankia TaxID=2994372 RepID=UPI0008DA5692|nr:MULTISPECIES: NAD(P)H-binding protein [unclassified Pseudofrankia]MDT3444555.1 NAD(P)H-binding protein [Pseudofrankia sp. BMG5.37]OHV56424.1 nucleoside-diphosphate sugar epimerase [Pseudofrankia sp. BMG5.36]